MLKKVTLYSIRLLKWSERYTKTDMVYLAHGGFWLSIAHSASSLAGFTLTFVLANTLSPVQLGEYRFLITGFTLMSILALPGMRTALRESTPKGYRGNLTHAFNAMFRWGILGTLTSLGAAGYYFFNENIQLAIGFSIIACIIPLYNASTGYLEYLTAIKQLRRTTTYTIATKILTVLITATVAFLFPQYAWAILAAFLLGTLIPNAVFHFKTVREFTKPTDAVDPDITRYAGHITIMTAFGLIAGQLDKIFIWKFIGAEGLAFFFIAHTVPQAISQYMIIVPTLAFAKFGEQDPRTIRRTLLPKIFKYFLIIALGVGAYIVAAPYLFNLVFPQYTDAIPYSQALALIPLFSAFMPIKTYLTTLKNTKALYILSTVPPAIRIGVAMVLIIPFGLWGAVFSLMAESIVRICLLIYFFLRTPR